MTKTILRFILQKNFLTKIIRFSNLLDFLIGKFGTNPLSYI